MENFNIIGFLVAVALTSVYYGAFPVLFSKTREKPITTKKYRWLCIGVTFALWVLSGFISGEVSTGAAALLWGTIFYQKGRGILEKKHLTERILEEPKKATITCDKCGKKFADNPENYAVIGNLKYCRFCIDEMDVEFEKRKTQQNSGCDFNRAGIAETEKQEKSKLITDEPEKLAMDEHPIPAITSNPTEDAGQVRFCRRCGKKLLESAKFCNYCGTRVLTVPTELSSDGVAEQGSDVSKYDETDIASAQSDPLPLGNLNVSSVDNLESENEQMKDGTNEKFKTPTVLMCPDCGGKVGVHAIACPHCGCTMSYILEKNNNLD